MDSLTSCNGCNAIAQLDDNGYCADCRDEQRGANTGDPAALAAIDAAGVASNEAVGDDDVEACVDCGAPRLAEHHDDDCPPGCESDGCVYHEMNPLDNGRCEPCSIERAKERHHRHLCACRGADSESGKRYTDPECEQAWLAVRWLAAL